MADDAAVPVGILISGRGSNMAALVAASARPGCAYRVALVASDRPDAAGLEHARRHDIPAIGFPAPGRGEKAGYEAALDTALRDAGVRVIALAGYMRLLSPEFVQRWEGRILNIHPSLLPRYKGLDTHARAIAAGDTVAGCSVHLVTAELDSGAVLGQAEVPVLAGDTPESLAERVLVEEHILYPRVLERFCASLAAS